eukprot:Skav236702  [mRNA]  locus=scaffold7366:27237:28874:+ [translate_table: standard]
MWNSAVDLWAALAPALPFTAVALLVLSHVYATKTQFGAGFCAYDLFVEKVSRADRATNFQLRFNDELFVARGKIMKNFCAVLIHFLLLLCLGVAWRFLEDPSLSSLCQLVSSLCGYAWVFCAPEMVKSQTHFRLLEAALVVVHTLFVIGLASETDVAMFDVSERIITIGAISSSILVIDLKVMPFYVCQSAVLMYSRWCLIGFAKMTPYLILMPVISYTVVGGVIALTVLTIQSNIAAKLDSGELTSLMLGFRQVLRGVCDGDLILDRRTKTVVDNASCLQRVLKSDKQFSNSNFLDLFLDSESRHKFSKFLEAEDTESSMPRGLRVSLQGARGPVSVDLFCTALPPSAGDYCLLAMKEDPLEQLQTTPPEAPPNAAPERIQQPRTELPERSTSRSSGPSEIVVAPDDLVEIALLVSDATGLLDIEQAHLYFQRKSAVSKIESGMPTLTKFIRPSDWDRLEAMFSTVTNLAPPDQRERCIFRRPTYFRVPGESGRYLCARHTSLRLADESIVPGRPSRFWMHLGKFDSKTRRLREGQLEDIEEEQ